LRKPLPGGPKWPERAGPEPARRRIEKLEEIIMKLNKCFAGLAVTAAICGCQSHVKDAPLAPTSTASAKITVDAAHPGHAISPTLWGIFFEDINLSADGGIYPELVRNLSFEDSDTLENWKFAAVGAGKSEAAVITADVHAQPPPLNPFNRKSLRVKADGGFTLQNEGYWGMNIVGGAGYTLKLAARGEKFDGKLTAKILSTNGTVLAGGEISGIGRSWEYHTLNLTAAGGDPKGKLEISGDGKGVLFLDMVSLLPKKTWKDHGLRPDLAESLDGLHPKFLRFPGGCWVEGDDFAHMNHWKNTVGNRDTRTPLWNIWGYYATQSLGYYEYLQLAEDLGAEPLFCINIGMSHKETIPMDRMAQWVQDALDAIEYANGPTNSVWGAMRAAAGHPAPFHLKYMEIGNENGGFKGYVEHWNLFYDAIRAKYPEIKFVADGWDKFGSRQPDIVDDHYYDTPEWFMRHANQYDNTDRNGPKVFVGEYAVTKNCGLGNLRGAIGEAAFMTGLERNSDAVVMASYAPLLVNLNHRAWNPDLINFDSSKWYGLPSYYVQQLFAENRGDVYLPTDVQAPVEEPAVTGGMIGVGTWNTAAEFKDIKVTAPDGKVLFQSDFSNGPKGWTLLGDGADWKAQDGALRQTAEKEFLRALAGDKKWTDYTLTLKARKISGAEGFLILFRINGSEDRNWWNIGGWVNTADAIEAGGTLDSKPNHIETDRWYDIKLVVSGKNVKCYLDGAVIHDVDFDAGGQITSLYATSATDEKSGDVIVKVVNASALPLETELDLAGAKNLTGQGTAAVLTSENATDENSLDNPTKVSPKTEAVNFTGTSLKRSFPGNSFTVLRLKTR
jgi:alpha-L-arabinofuranosidase